MQLQAVFTKKNFAIVSAIIFTSMIFFRGFVLDGKMSVTSGDPAIRFWDTVNGAKQIQSTGFSLWDFKSSTGTNIVQNDIISTPFSLYSIFCALFNDFDFAHTMYKWIEVLILGFLLFVYLQGNLEFKPWIAFFVFATFLFTPGWINEYFLNSFGGYVFVPLLIVFADKYALTRSISWAVMSGLCLAFMHWSSNAAVAQFSAIFVGVYVLYITYGGQSIGSYFRTVSIFSLVTGIVWIGMMGFFMLPFLHNAFHAERSHSYSIGGGIGMWQIIKSFFIPYTAWTFFDHKMITTGFLTKFDSFDCFFGVLTFPSLVFFCMNRVNFTRRERFFLYYSAGFLFLAWLNLYVPLLGLLTVITKSTGWWRAIPIHFLTCAISVGIVLNHCMKGAPLSKHTKYLSWFTGCLAFVYGGAFVALICSYGIYSVSPNSFLRLLSPLSVRPVSHIADFLSQYYFKWPQLPCLFLIPLSGAYLLWGFHTLIQGKRLEKKSQIGLCGAALFGGLSMLQLYYPFNDGIHHAQFSKETDFIKQMVSKDRIAFLYNDQSLIESKIKKDLKYNDKDANLSFNLTLAEYPEIGRIQSDVFIQGGYARSLGALVYTKGNSFTDPFISRFHFEIIKDYEAEVKAFKRGKYDLRLTRDMLNNPLLKYLALKHIFTSLPVENSHLKLIAKGNYFYIYENTNSLPLLYFAEQVFSTKSRDVLETMKAAAIDSNRPAIVEDMQMLFKPSGSGKIKDIKFGADNLQVHTTSEAEQFLVFADTLDRNWKGYVDGGEVPLYRTNFFGKGLVVPKGEHTAAFVYEDNFFSYGVYLSFMTFVFSLIILLFPFRRQIKEIIWRRSASTVSRP